MDHRIYNFSAGPATLPEPVLEEVRKELMNYRGCGMGVMELSHRSREFRSLLDRAQEDLRRLMEIPDSYRVLFLQGGATLQFSMVPANLLKNGGADYIVSGAWSKKAFAEGKKWGNVRCAASSEPAQFTCLPPLSREAFRENADYVYLCENETIHGTAFSHLPDTGGRPVVSDQSSLFLSRPCRVSDYGLIFASAQKNAGPAGLTLVILREDLMGPPPDPKTPSYLRYDLHAQADSLYNTPNCWAIYVCGKIFRHLLETGGLEAAAARNREKSGLLYDFLDNSSLFHPIAAKKDRSSTNIPFTTGSRALDEAAIAAAEQAGLTGLRGHRSLGGLRASLYNAMPKAGVEALVAFLRDFEEIPG